jgi:hypothetical protein
VVVKTIAIDAIQSHRFIVDSFRTSPAGGNAFRSPVIECVGKQLSKSMRTHHRTENRFGWIIRADATNRYNQAEDSQSSPLQIPQLPQVHAIVVSSPFCRLLGLSHSSFLIWPLQPICRYKPHGPVGRMP